MHVYSHCQYSERHSGEHFTRATTKQGVQAEMQIRKTPIAGCFFRMRHVFFHVLMPKKDASPAVHIATWEKKT